MASAAPNAVTTRAGRAPGAVYGAMVLVLLVVLATLAFSVHQPPPPTVAAFAPGAVHQIKNPPPNQAGNTGANGGTGGSKTPSKPKPKPLKPGQHPTPTPTAAPTSPTVIVPAQLNCVGNPPRQIEDPQSPPCISYFAGNNGGATSFGVTQNQITVVVPGGGAFDDEIADYFNEHFEFYGRRLVVKDSKTGGDATAAQQKSQADSDRSTYKPFAATDYHDALGTWYRLEDSRLGVVYADSDGSYADYPPDTFGYVMDAPDLFDNLGQWLCNGLVGHPAANAGAALRGQTRKFGIVMDTYDTDDSTDPTPLVSALTNCRAKPVDVAFQQFNVSATAGVDPQAASEIMAKMKTEGATSVICLCQTYEPQALMNASDELDYQPEWIFSSYGIDDDPAFLKTEGVPAQLAHAFGLTFQPPMAPLIDEPFYWAINAVDPTYTFDTDEDLGRNTELEPYRSLLMIASGIQMAGPDLTPATFAAGLQRAMFPNPPFFTKPGAVDFTSGTKTMTTDAAMWFWNTTAAEPDSGNTGTGTDCYVDDGERFKLGNWPTSEPVFNTPNFAGTACNTGSGF